MAIPNNYIDKITNKDSGESRIISPAADKVRVDNENFEGTDLDEVLDEVAHAIDESGSGDGTVTGVKVGSTTYEPTDGVVDLSTPFGGKVDKNGTDSLMTAAEHTKLQNLPTSDFLSSTYATKTEVNGKQDALTFDNTPTDGSNNPVKSDGIKVYIDGKATIDDVSTNQDGSFTIKQSDGNSFTVNLNHSHPQYLTAHQSLEGRVQSTDVVQIVVLADEAAYTSLATKDSSTLYLIPESAS